MFISFSIALISRMDRIPSEKVVVDSQLYFYYDTTMSKCHARIEVEIACVKKNLMGLGRMHPGSLSKQKRSRGGEYHQLSYSHGGKGHTKYVRPEDVPEVMQELENYRRFQELTRKWVQLEIELAKLRRNGGRSKRSNTGKEQRHTR